MAIIVKKKMLGFQILSSLRWIQLNLYKLLYNKQIELQISLQLTLYHRIKNLIFMLILKLNMAFCENTYNFILVVVLNQPYPSVVVSIPPNDTMKSLKKATYIVLFLGYVLGSSLFRISSIGLTLVVSKPVIVSSFFLSISILKA